MRSTRALFLLLALVLGLTAAACGSDDDAGASRTPAGAGTDEPGTDDPGEFPVTIEHKYGSTTIPSAPERVVSVGFTDQDFLLALGVTPVAIREWYGEHPHATWPWAQDDLGHAEPDVLSSADLNFEAIAALRPDLIVGVSSGMTDQEYATLSAIAPTITQSGDFVDYGMPWKDAHRMVGAAVGEPDLAEDQIEELEARFAAIADEHPEWAGAEATMSYATSESEVGAYTSQDTRGRLLVDLGFTVPAEIDDLAGDLFYSSFSFEEIDRLDRDLLVWIGAESDIAERIRTHPLHDGLGVAREGREIFLSVEQGAAAGFSSPLSLPYLLDSFVPQVEAAMDGDPATEVPTG